MYAKEREPVGVADVQGRENVCVGIEESPAALVVNKGSSNKINRTTSPEFNGNPGSMDDPVSPDWPPVEVWSRQSGAKAAKWVTHVGYDGRGIHRSLNAGHGLAPLALRT